MSFQRNHNPNPQRERELFRKRKRRGTVAGRKVKHSVYTWRLFHSGCTIPQPKLTPHPNLLNPGHFCYKPQTLDSVVVRCQHTSICRRVDLFSLQVPLGSLLSLQYGAELCGIKYNVITPANPALLFLRNVCSFFQEVWK